MPTAHTHDHSDNSFSFPTVTGPAKYEQYVTFPSGPQYHSSYMSPGYPDQQGGEAYGSWPGPGRASPPPTFPVSAMAYGGPGPSYGSGIESQYPGGPSFPSTTSTGSGGGGERLNFPEGPGGSYFDDSSSYPAPWSSTGGHSPGHHPSDGAKQSTSGALGFALSAVDKVAGRKARDGLESQVGHIAQSKLFNKFTK